MDQYDQKTMETLLDLFEHDGWKIFIEEHEVLSKHLKEQAYLECNSNDEWQQRRGSLAILDRVLSYEPLIKYVIDNQDEHDVQDI